MYLWNRHTIGSAVGCWDAEQQITANAGGRYPHMRGFRWAGAGSALLGCWRESQGLVLGIPAQTRPNSPAQIFFPVFPAVQNLPMLVCIRKGVQDITHVGSRRRRQISESKRMSQPCARANRVHQLGVLTFGLLLKPPRDRTQPCRQVPGA